MATFIGPMQFGYGTGPGMSGRGFFEQQTPAGSFVSAEQQRAQGMAPVQTQQAGNPFLGQTSQGIAGQASVQPFAQQAASLGTQANPWLGGTTQQAAQVGSNAFGGGNPYLGQAIDSAQADARRQFDLSVRPALDAQMRASGSFGNSAIQELQQNAYSDLGRNLGNIASGMRMQDYTQQQQLAENALNRQQQINMFNSGLSAGDLNRNLQGFLGSQGIGLQGLGMGLGAAQFDASLGNNVNQFNAGLRAGDLNRNANLAQNLGMFNAGQANNMGQFNASLGQNNNQFNAAQGNAMNQFNAGSGNAMLGQFRNLTEQGRQFDASLGQRQNEFNRNMDWNQGQYWQNRQDNNERFNRGMDFTNWQANVNNMRGGMNDQLNALNTLMGWQAMGMNAANQQQMTPLQIWQQLSGTSGGLAGLGGSGTATQQQQLFGNPWLGALGGWNLFRP